MKGYIMRRYPMTQRITVDGQRVRVTPVKYYDDVMPGYFMNKDGDVFVKNSNGTRMLQTRMSGQQTYPHITIKNQFGKRKSHAVHRLVAFTLVPFKPPGEIAKDEWEYICKYLPTTKKFIEENTQVNHIDADHENYHPTNLEWLSGKHNHKAYYRDHGNTNQVFVSENSDMDIEFKMSKTLKRKIK